MNPYAKVKVVKPEQRRLHNTDPRFVRNGDGKRFGGWLERSTKVKSGSK